MIAISATADSSRLSSRFHAVRLATERLSARLTPEDQMVQSMADASPTKWHLAHTTWFYETFLLGPFVRGYKPFDTHYAFLFNSYYKQLEGHPRRSIRGTFSRPGLAEVRAYRAHVDAAMSELLQEPSPDIADLIQLGINHEQQHQELIVTDIKHAFWTNPLQPSLVAGAPVGKEESVPLEWLEFAGGLHEIGHQGGGFAFDNERPRHRVYLEPFRLASRLTTNAEYLDFLEAGGYRQPELWLSDGWDQVGQSGWQAPLYWERQDRDWWVFTAAGMRPLDLNGPVCHLSYYEADAYARWRGCRLPTEAEWEVAAAGMPLEGTFAESERFHPTPCTRPGLAQMFGDVWQWTASPYSAYPGYQPPAGVLGEYNGKFMCNQLVLRGGSCATPEAHLRATYRNFFPPHARWQFMGVRLANAC
jgi:ergothioneine biosynthesis protein EgtB